MVSASISLRRLDEVLTARKEGPAPARAIPNIFVIWAPGVVGGHRRAVH